MNCLICNMDVKLDNANFVVHHIKKVHGLTSQEYYDKYFKKEGEGICLQCTNPTSFKSISAGYSIYCIDLLPRLKPWDSNAYCAIGASK